MVGLNELMNPIQTPHFIEEKTAVEVKMWSDWSWPHNDSVEKLTSSWLHLPLWMPSCPPEPESNLTSFRIENNSAALKTVPFELHNVIIYSTHLAFALLSCILNRHVCVCILLSSA